MKVLLAVDGSDHAERGVTLLGRLTRNRRHALTAISVTPPETASQDPSLRVLAHALRSTGRRMLEAVAAAWRRAGWRRVATRLTPSFDVAGSVLAAAERARTGLIVVGARGLSRLKAFFLGSVSNRVAKHALRPVLVVRPGPRRGRARVLLAVDGSSASVRAAAFLERLDLPPTAEITVVHAVPDPLPLWAPEFGFAEVYEEKAGIHAELLRRSRRSGEELLAGWKERLGRRHRHVTSRLLSGDAAAEILRAARDLAPDVVVLGRRGLSGWERFLLGSVSQKVVTHTRVSVLLVP